MKESDLHTKRTGHTEFVDKTLEASKPITLEVPKASDAGAEGAADASSSQSEGTSHSIVLLYLFWFQLKRESFFL